MRLSALIIDDDIIVTRVLTQLLEELGFSVLNGTTAKRGIEHLESLLPDVIISDLQMLDMDGAEFVTFIRNHKNARIRNAAVIGISGAPESEAKFMCAGADAFLLKPLPRRPTVLINAVRAAVEKRKSGDMMIG